MLKSSSSSQHLDQSNIWQTLAKPIIGLAPMDGITDTAYRIIQKKYGNPDVVYTEFASVEGLCHQGKAILKQLIYSDFERPIIVQLFGKTPRYFRQVAIMCCQMGFDGIDLNMGCPATRVAQHGSGGALIKQPKLAQQIIRATQAGVQAYFNGQRVADCPDLGEEIKNFINKKQYLVNNKLSKALLIKTPFNQSAKIKAKHLHSLPISVKTRIGYHQPIVQSWITTLLECQPAAIALHGRTLKQAYRGRADWEEIGQAAAIINKRCILLGNGDVQSRAEAISKCQQYGLDGVLIGRASQGNPFVFHQQQRNLAVQEFLIRKKNQVRPPSKLLNLLKLALEHAQLYEKIFQNYSKYSFLPMRKQLAWYIKGIKNATDWRLQLVKTNNSKEVNKILDKIKSI